jgi:NAD+ synthase
VQLRIALAQLNPTVGDVSGNLERIRKARAQAAAEGADLVVLSELAVIGYPPEDLVLRPSAVDACRAAVETLVSESASGPALIATTPWREDGHLYNAVVVIDRGKTEVRFKSDLPNYGVFDEKRIFTPGPPPAPVDFRGIRIWRSLAPSSFSCRTDRRSSVGSSPRASSSRRPARTKPENRWRT